MKFQIHIHGEPIVNHKREIFVCPDYVTADHNLKLCGRAAKIVAIDFEHNGSDFCDYIEAHPGGTYGISHFKKWLLKRANKQLTCLS